MTIASSIRADDLPEVTSLLRAGADPNRRDVDGLTPLMIAAGLGRSHMGVEPRMGATALHKAAQSGDVDVIGSLLNHGAFIDQQSPVLGNTALVDATLHRNTEAVALLLSRGAKVAIENLWQQTALEVARADRLEAISRLIEEQVARNEEAVGALLLVAAVKSNDPAEVARLIAAGASVNERVPMVGSLDDHYTPLGIAARDGHTEIAHLLIDAGADLDRVIGLMGGTALHDATYFGRVDIIRSLTRASRDAGSRSPT
jgi:ankyrin repeat protein